MSAFNKTRSKVKLPLSSPIFSLHIILPDLAIDNVSIDAKNVTCNTGSE